MKKNYLLILASSLLLLASCQDDDTTPSAGSDDVPVEGANSKVVGMYLLNEGNWGSNKCTLDYLDYESGEYIRNLYGERNPTVVMGLGDMGSDVQVYGSKLYIVVNGSNKMEVLDAATGLRITQVDIPNCRYVRFHEGHAYVSSYVSLGEYENTNEASGAVYKVDTLTLKVVDECAVGCQPEELDVVGNHLYVANSGGYNAPAYDNTVSVVDLTTFKEVEKVVVDVNLHRLKSDNDGNLWVTSRGDYGAIASNFYVMATDEDASKVQVTDTLNLSCSNFCIKGDSLFYYSSEWSYATMSSVITYGIINTKTRQKVSDNFITDGTAGDITAPYGINVHPTTGDIYITDAKNYVSSGMLYCYSNDGTLKWSVTAGDIPSCMCFVYGSDTAGE